MISKRYFPTSSESRRTCLGIGKRRLLFACCAIAGLLGQSSCVTDVEDPLLPSSPILVKQTALGIFPRKGIRPGCGENAILLEWHAEPGERIEEYRIYRSGNLSIGFQLLGTIQRSGASIDTQFTDRTPQADSMYFYCVRGMNRSGYVSDPSDTIGYSLLHRAKLMSPSTYLSPNAAFQWILEPVDSEADFYNVELADEYQHPIYSSKPILRTMYGGLESWVLTDLDLELGRRYYIRICAFGRIDSLGCPRTGSISRWCSFQVRWSQNN